MYYLTPFYASKDDTLIADTGPWQAGSCDQIVPYTLKNPPSHLAIGMRPETEAWTELAWNGPTPLIFPHVQDDGTHLGESCTWFVCTACDESSCQRLDLTNPSTTLTLSGIVYLHVAASAVQGGGRPELGCWMEASDGGT